MSKQVHLQAMTLDSAIRAIEASAWLAPDEHVDGCPIKQGVSVDCAFPFEACVPDDWSEQ